MRKKTIRQRLMMAAVMIMMVVNGFCGEKEELEREIGEAMESILQIAEGCGWISSETRKELRFEAKDLFEAAPLVLQAFEISQRATERERRHNEELRSRGISEVARAVGATRYRLNTGGLGEFLFTEWGEFYIDRRFVTDDELEIIKRLEAFVLARFPSVKREIKSRPPRKSAGACGAPIFFGFEDSRYQQHDEMIAKMVSEFNANKAKWCGGTEGQAEKIADITVAMVKSQMIEESGGNDARSKAAWAVDPLQVNVPGDWGDEKRLVGLKKPWRRNEGKVENNIRAAIMYLSRKGFSSSARPAEERPKGFFDGWKMALQRYNGRRDRTETDRYYSDEYAEKILRRANNPNLFVPIEIKLAKGG